MTAYNILLTGHSQAELNTLAEALRPLDKVEVRSRVMEIGEVDPLSKGQTPSLLIHFLGDQSEAELATLAARPARMRPELLVVGASGGDNPGILRLAMQAGARDFIHFPANIPEVVATVTALVREKASETQESSTLTAFISPKGGGGASTVAEGVAHVLRARFGLSTLLMDLDCQFGTQYLNLDLRPDKGLKEALDAVESLDEVALRGYVGQHPSGLHVLGSLPSQIILPGEITEKRLYRLLELLMAAYNQIVVDMPCTVDSTFSLIVEKMRHIVMVVQQDFQNVRNAQKLNQILRDELQVPPRSVAVVVNRYDPHNAITLKDIEQALQLKICGIVPSDYRSVNDAANLGVPLMEHAPKSPVTTSLVDLSGWVIGHEAVAAEKPAGLMQKLRQAFTSRS